MARFYGTKSSYSQSINIYWQADLTMALTIQMLQEPHFVGVLRDKTSYVDVQTHYTDCYIGR